MPKNDDRLPLGSPQAHHKALAALLRDNARRHRLSRVFSDFCELGAISISNAVDRSQFERREARYLELVANYEPDEVVRFACMLAVLVEWLELGFADCLGELFMGLELGDDFKGQFFTPYPVASMMARMSVSDARALIAAQGFIRVNEPTSGAGGMVIACADALHAQGINYQQAMHVVAQDIDSTAVHMTYLQLALLHVPAVVVHGNSLSVKAWSHWVTPAHVLGGWDRRLQTHAAEQSAMAEFEVPTLSDTEVQLRDSIADPTSNASTPAGRNVIDERLQQMGLFE
jgi:N-6 DNA Methylase